MAIRDLFKQRDYKQDKNWKSADEWYNSFKPKDDVDYDLALDFAKSRYEELRETHEILDKKAEWCFALAIATTGGLVAYRDKLGMTLEWCFPSIACLLVAMWFALRARLPGANAAPFSVHSGIERTENTKHFKAWLCASLHCATVGMQVANDWKALQLKAAGRLIVIGIAVLCIFAWISRITWPAWMLR